MDESRYGNVMRFRTTQPWSLLLIDAHDFTRECMADLLAGSDDQLEVRTAATVLDADLEDCDDCNVVLIRVECGDPGDARLRQTLAELKDMLPGVPVALLSGRCDMDTALAAVRCGVRGYLSPSLGIEQILAALRLVCTGGVYIAPANGAPGLRLPEPPRRPLAAEPPASSLTPREAQVLAHLRQGKPNKVIAYELGMSENTVKAHVGHILKKLGATNRTAIACMPEPGET